MRKALFYRYARYSTSSLACLLLSALALAACGRSGGPPRLAGAYVYADPQSREMFALDFVQHGATLTGNARYLNTVTAGQAQEEKFKGAEFVVAGNRVLPWNATNSANLANGLTDDGACGGKSACFERLEIGAAGRLGNNDRISVTFQGPLGAIFGAHTILGSFAHGDLSFSVAGTSITLRPTTEQGVQATYNRVLATLPEAIQTASLSERAELLEKPSSLSEDVEGLNTALEEAKEGPFPNPFVCEFEALFSRQIDAVQEDVRWKDALVAKAHQELQPYLTPGTRLYAYAQASGYVAKLTAAEKATIRNINKETSEANAIIAKANQDAPSMINVLNGIKCAVGKELETEFHLLPLYQQAGNFAP
jgi:hypothetical protein